MKGILKKLSIIVAALTAATLIIAADVWFEVNVPKAVAVNIRSEKIPPGRSLRLAQISDVHGAEITTHKSLMKEVVSFNPEAIILTGDLIDRSTVDFSGIYRDMGELEKVAPVIFVTGNHELANPEGEEFIRGLRKAGVNVLRNSSMIVRNSDGAFVVAGIEDAHFGGDDITKALKGIDASSYNILLSHTPSVALRVEGETAVDLILSGHTHGGQVRLPLLGAVFLPDSKTPRALIKGLFKTEEGIAAYTDSGFGTSVIPVRFMDRSQISLITVSSGAK